MKIYIEKILKSFKDFIKNLFEYKKMKAFLIITNIEIKNEVLLFSDKKNSNKLIVPRIFERSPSKEELNDLQLDLELLKSNSKKNLELDLECINKSFEYWKKNIEETGKWKKLVEETRKSIIPIIFERSPYKKDWEDLEDWEEYSFESSK